MAGLRRSEGQLHPAPFQWRGFFIAFDFAGLFQIQLHDFAPPIHFALVGERFSGDKRRNGGTHFILGEAQRKFWQHFEYCFFHGCIFVGIQLAAIFGNIDTADDDFLGQCIHPQPQV